MLTAEGSIYRRGGVTPTNWVGDYWERVPRPETMNKVRIFKLIAAMEFDIYW